MTWSVRIVAKGVESVPGGNVCGGCKHSDGCQLHKAVGPIQDLLTNLDGRCDGSWANGDGELVCAGFEANEPVTDDDSTDKDGDKEGSAEA